MSTRFITPSLSSRLCSIQINLGDRWQRLLLSHTPVTFNCAHGHRLVWKFNMTYNLTNSEQNWITALQQTPKSFWGTCKSVGITFDHIHFTLKESGCLPWITSTTYPISSWWADKCARRQSQWILPSADLVATGGFKHGRYSNLKKKLSFCHERHMIDGWPTGWTNITDFIDPYVSSYGQKIHNSIPPIAIQICNIHTNGNVGFWRSLCT